MDSKTTDAERIAIIGAGASGLALGWLLSKAGKRVTLFEAAPQVGGLARTFDWRGIPCDIAPHRLHTSDMEVLHAIQALLPLREHQRHSRILMRDKQIQDPINPIELLLRFPPSTGFKLVWGFLNRPKLPETSFEQLALNRYGQGLYDFFFEPYTKKMSGEDIPLRFKRIQLVYLDIAKPEVMPYQWVYFGDGDVVINRMAEFKHFHPDLPPTDHSVLCAEVTMDSEHAEEDVIQALTRYGLVRREEILDTKVLDEKFGYPVYDRGFEEARARADALFGRFGNLHCVGRNAEFRHIETDEDIASAAACLRAIYGRDAIRLDA